MWISIGLQYLDDQLLLSDWYSKGPSSKVSLRVSLPLSYLWLLLWEIGTQELEINLLSVLFSWRRQANIDIKIVKNFKKLFLLPVIKLLDLLQNSVDGNLLGLTLMQCLLLALVNLLLLFGHHFILLHEFFSDQVYYFIIWLGLKLSDILPFRDVLREGPPKGICIYRLLHKVIRLLRCLNNLLRNNVRSSSVSDPSLTLRGSHCRRHHIRGRVARLKLSGGELGEA